MRNTITITGLALALALSAAAQSQNTQATTTTAEQTTTTSPKLNNSIADVPQLPAGTTIKMKLETGISTAVTKVGDNFAGRVTQDVTNAGKIVIPVGSSVQGRVTSVVENRRYKGRPSLQLRPETVTLPNGDKFNINAVLVKTDKDTGTKVNGEGRIIGSGIDRRDKLEIAAGAAGGAGLGGLATHSAKGAFVGAVIGGGGAVVYWLTKHKSASVEAGTEIVMELDRPMAIVTAGD
jgi:hypothetical protein